MVRHLARRFFFATHLLPLHDLAPRASGKLPSSPARRESLTTEFGYPFEAFNFGRGIGWGCAAVSDSRLSIMHVWAHENKYKYCIVTQINTLRNTLQAREGPRPECACALTCCVRVP